MIFVRSHCYLIGSTLQCGLSQPRRGTAVWKLRRWEANTVETMASYRCRLDAASGDIPVGGGILSDECGLCEILTSLLLVYHSSALRRPTGYIHWSTLVVCPSGVVDTWLTEIAYLVGNALTVYVFHRTAEDTWGTLSTSVMIADCSKIGPIYIDYIYLWTGWPKLMHKCGFLDEHTDSGIPAACIWARYVCSLSAYQMIPCTKKILNWMDCILIDVIETFPYTALLQSHSTTLYAYEASLAQFILFDLYWDPWPFGYPAANLKLCDTWV